MPNATSRKNWWLWLSELTRIIFLSLSLLLVRRHSLTSVFGQLGHNHMQIDAKLTGIPLAVKPIQFSFEGVKMPTLKCNLCGETFCKTSNYTYHYKFIHENGIIYYFKCSICPEQKIFKYSRNLLKHFRNVIRSDKELREYHSKAERVPIDQKKRTSDLNQPVLPAPFLDKSDQQTSNTRRRTTRRAQFVIRSPSIHFLF